MGGQQLPTSREPPPLCALLHHFGRIRVGGASKLQPTLFCYPQASQWHRSHESMQHVFVRKAKRSAHASDDYRFDVYLLFFLFPSPSFGFPLAVLPCGGLGVGVGADSCCVSCANSRALTIFTNCSQLQLLPR